MSIFEQASRLDLHFETNRGNLPTAEMWKLKLQSSNGFDLDTTAKEVNRKLKEFDEGSFVTNNDSPRKDLLNLQLDILKYIIADKQEKIKSQKEAAEKAAKRERLLSILADKQDEELKGMTKEEIQAQLEAL